LSGSEPNISYKIKENGQTLPGTGEPITFPIDATASSNGIYTITALNTETGCESDMTKQAEINIQPGVGAPIITGEPQYCNKEITQLVAEVTNATSKTWSLSPTSAGAINDGLVTWTENYAGPVTISLEASNAGCSTQTKTATFLTEVTTKPEVSPIQGDTLVCKGNHVTYQIVPQKGITYNWTINTGATMEVSDAEGKVVITFTDNISPEGAILTVTPTSLSCGSGFPQTKVIKKNNGCDLFVPNILTPSSDDKFSGWAIEGVDNFPKLDIQIFNRWGNKVHSQSGRYDKLWNGTNTQGQPLPTATYYYIIDKNDGSDKLTGSVTVVRD
jgi:gliding motility-associated-like protein